MPRPTLPLKTKFYGYVLIPDFDNECWIWVGNGRRYGEYTHKGRTYRAHRLAWQIYNGQIPNGKCVLHVCDVPKCVNPNHLFLGTQLENIADMASKGRSRGVPRNRHNNPKLKESDIPRIQHLRKEGLSQQEIADIYSVSQTLISKIVRHERWSTKTNG